jgi:hypothetical protein
MTRLHIEHAITDFDTWRGAFDRFAAMRATAGVTGTRLARPVDDDHFIVIDLDFPSPDQAAAFLDVLHRHVWATPENSPGLNGAPRTMILEDVV